MWFRNLQLYRLPENWDLSARARTINRDSECEMKSVLKRVIEGV